MRVEAEGGKFRETKHGQLNKGVNVSGDVPTGSCRQCHGSHARRDSAKLQSSVSPDILGKNELCAKCHDAPLGAKWLGMNEYTFSGHGSSTETYPRHGGREVRLCVQCHDPHGTVDGQVGLIPSMLRRTEENGCMGKGGESGGCHSADSADRPVTAKDLESEQRKQYTHPVGRTRLRHKPGELEETQPGQGSAAARHVECEDCHNSHTARPGIHEEGTNVASPVLLGSFGVRPIAWPPAGQPVTNWEVVLFDPRRARSDNLECHLCFQCHSYFAYGNSPPPDESDMARLFNPNNASFHPVAAEGRNPDVPSLLPPWNETSRMYCSDCHGSDDVPSDRVPFGPHGSRHNHILRRAYPAGGSPPAREDLCFLCHDAEAYVENGARTGWSDSGFRSDQSNLHLLQGHTASGCPACHTVHGSPDLPHLLAVRDRVNRRSRIETFTVPPAGDYDIAGCGTIEEGGDPCHGQM